MLDYFYIINLKFNKKFIKTYRVTLKSKVHLEMETKSKYLETPNLRFLEILEAYQAITKQLNTRIF